eukprot:TRINITY_DN3254_c0_g1_i10.p1 TRINITY_DN3254_c0_g1~~TRINITY_DN3254_c0_g1_i10.p1  ORF type:complete len:463 (+),score=64.52 TRINITY_DN3254_c0_g1_i10:123-1511(+)
MKHSLFLFGVALSSLCLSVLGGPQAVPTPIQLAWAKEEIGAIISWGMETSASNVSDLGFCSFNTGEDGRGPWFAPVSLYQPQYIDTDQWLKAVASFGGKYAVFTAKHCSGFALWPTKVPGYNYSVAHSPFPYARKDIVASFIASCKKYGVKPGLYYGTNFNFYLNILNSKIGFNKTSLVAGQIYTELPAYDQIVLQQLNELWTEYGDLAEIWFDGGTNVTGVAALLDRLQPNAISFQGPYPLQNVIRWSGTELGIPPYPCWSASESSNTYGKGDPYAPTWAPVETDTTIRNSDAWFWRDDYYKTGLKNLSVLMTEYEASVGSNTNFLLNLSPDPYGVVPLEDIDTYISLGELIKKCYTTPLNATVTHTTPTSINLNLKSPQQINRIVIQEYQQKGQNVLSYTVTGRASASSPWLLLSNGTSIGNKRIEMMMMPTAISELILDIADYISMPSITFLGVYLCLY